MGDDKRVDVKRLLIRQIEAEIQEWKSNSDNGLPCLCVNRNTLYAVQEEPTYIQSTAASVGVVVIGVVWGIPFIFTDQLNDYIILSAGEERVANCIREYLDKDVSELQPIVISDLLD